MPSINDLLYAVAFAGLTIAAPTSHQQSFSVPRKLVRAGFKTRGQTQHLKTYLKHHVTPPARVLAAAQGVTGSVVALGSGEFEGEYLSAVNVGGTNLYMDFDTGSSDMWVFSNLLPKNQIGNHSFYTVDPSKKVNGLTWNITYAEGSSAAGIVYSDTIKIGGASFPSQIVGAATAISSTFVNDVTEGLLGLGFQSANTVSPNKQNSFLGNIAPSLAAPIMAADLKHKAAGSYDFGFIDKSKYTGSIHYVPVYTAYGQWNFNVTGYGTSDRNLTKDNTDTIADTGTTFIYLPSAAVAPYWAKVKGAVNDPNHGAYTYPCNATLPDLYIRLEDYVSRVPGKYLSYAPVETGSKTCYGALQSGDFLGFSILGLSWLKAHYVVFDERGPQLGVATKKLC